MLTPLPTPGQAVAIRENSGREAVVRVTEVEAPLIHVASAPPFQVGEVLDGAFVDVEGTGHRMRARTLHHADDAATLRIEFVTTLRGRFLRRFAPPRPLLAELVLPSGMISGRVLDLALTGVGVAAEGVEVGDALMITLTDLDGQRVVDGVTASAVRVTDGIVGVAFDHPYDAAPAILALANDAPAR
jgi:hypothetical protein